MTFQQWSQVLDGSKTQTRRVIRTGEHLLPLSNGDEVVYSGGRTKWKIGRTYAIQPGRGQKALGRFKLLAIRREWLWEISIEDIKAEGVRPLIPDDVLFRLGWLGLWNSINRRKGHRHQDNPEVWALGLEVASEEEV